MSLNINLEPIIQDGIEKALKAMDLETMVKQNSKMITVVLPDGTENKMGQQHKQFESILKLVSLGENLMIKGDAGNGKSYTVQQVAKALGLNFHSMSVSNQTTKTDLLGFVDANGVYRYNGFISAFRDGGVFNMDEIDAGNANVLVVMNSALSNGFVEAPNGEMIYAHKDFRFTATANTTGRGATAQYVGRNKLDSATLDRFAVINYELDEAIELLMCQGDKPFHKAIKAMRVEAEKNYENFMISQRSSSRLYNLVTNGFEIDEALEIAVFKGCDEDIVKALTKKFKNVGWTQESTEEVVEEKPTVVPVIPQVDPEATSMETDEEEEYDEEEMEESDAEESDSDSNMDW